MARRKTISDSTIEDTITTEVAEEKPLLNPVFVRKSEEPEPKVKHVVSSDLVCVALNRPYGVSFRMPDGRKVVLNGNGEPLIGKEKGVLPVGAYGMTMVAREDWEYIVRTFGEYQLFKNGLCFAANRKRDAEKEADSRDDLRNGLEPVDISKTNTSEAKGE